MESKKKKIKTKLRESPGWVAQLVTQGTYPVGGVQEATDGWFSLYIEIEMTLSFTFSLPSPLSENK